MDWEIDIKTKFAAFDRGYGFPQEIGIPPKYQIDGLPSKESMKPEQTRDQNGMWRNLLDLSRVFTSFLGKKD